MNNCFLALGSNLKRPPFQLRRAIRALRHIPRTHVLKIAPTYVNKAIGRKTQPLFYNTVVQIKTGLPPHTLLKHCQMVELRQGRQRLIKWGARTLDIDILLYHSKKINTPTLTIPHPEMMRRDFVLIPLSCILNDRAGTTAP